MRKVKKLKRIKKSSKSHKKHSRYSASAYKTMEVPFRRIYSSSRVPMSYSAPKNFHINPHILLNS